MEISVLALESRDQGFADGHAWSPVAVVVFMQHWFVKGLIETEK